MPPTSDDDESSESPSPKKPRVSRRIKSKRATAASWRDRHLSSRRLEGHGGSLREYAEKYVPLVHESSRHDVREHKAFSIAGGGTGLLVTSVASAAGGSVAGLVVAVGGGVIIHAAAKGHSKGRAAASGFMVGGLIAVGLNVLSSGSLTGSAKLGATIPNLKQLARVAQRNPGAVFGVALTGLGVPRQTVRALTLGQGLKLPALPASFAAALKKWGLVSPPPALTGGRRTLAQATGAPFALSPFSAEKGENWRGPGEYDGNSYHTSAGNGPPAQPVDGFNQSLRSWDSTAQRETAPLVPETHSRSASGWLVPLPKN